MSSATSTTTTTTPLILVLILAVSTAASATSDSKSTTPIPPPTPPSNGQSSAKSTSTTPIPPPPHGQSSSKSTGSTPNPPPPHGQTSSKSTSNTPIPPPPHGQSSSKSTGSTPIPQPPPSSAKSKSSTLIPPPPPSPRSKSSAKSTTSTPINPPPPPPRDQSSAGAGTIDPNHAEYNGEALASQFLYAHNKIRARFYLPALKWNRTLARFARHYANSRMKDCLLQHSSDRIYGENMFWSKYGHWTPANVVKTWADEMKYYDFESNQCVQSQPCGHFTQIIWKSTTQVGCGRVQCLNNKGFLYVCSYDPPGNYYFEGPFGGKFANSIVS